MSVKDVEGGAEPGSAIKSFGETVPVGWMDTGSFTVVKLGCAKWGGLNIAESAGDSRSSTKCAEKSNRSSSISKSICIRKSTSGWGKGKVGNTPCGILEVDMTRR